MRWAVLLVVVTGCGRIGFGGLDGGAGGGDDAPGGNGDGANVDMMIDGPSSLSPGCGPTVIIDDDFSTAGNGAFTPVNTSTYTIAESGGIVRIGVPGNAAVDSRAAMKQTAMIDLNGVCAIAELSIAGTGANLRSYLRLGGPTKYISVYVEAGQVFGRFFVMGTTGTIGPFAYNATAMRFLRLRSIGNRNYAVEYSSSLTGPFTMAGAQGGSFSDPSPSSVEVGVHAVGAVLSTVVEFERVLVLGP